MIRMKRLKGCKIKKKTMIVMMLEVMKNLSASKFIKLSMDLVRIWDLVANRTTRLATLECI